MMVTDLRCWWQNHYVGDFFAMLVIFAMYLIGHQHSETVTNISKLSPTQLVWNIRHQHRCNHFKYTPSAEFGQFQIATSILVMKCLGDMLKITSWSLRLLITNVGDRFAAIHSPTWLFRHQHFQAITNIIAIIDNFQFDAFLKCFSLQLVTWHKNLSHFQS